MPPFRTDRNDRPGGGVIVYVRDTLSCKRRVDLEVQGVEGVWLELTIKSKRILVGGFYRPPKSSLEYFNLLKDNYSINQLLYGIEDSTLQENTTLFIEVQNFLTSCGRFNQRR